MSPKNFSTCKVLRTDHEIDFSAVDQALRDSGIHLVTIGQNADRSVLLREMQDTDLLLMCYSEISAEVFAAAPKLKGIIKYGVGIDSIDIEEAKKRQIPVVNIPDYAEETVAEGAFTLMLALAKKFKIIQQQMDHHGWVWPTPQWLGSDLAGKNLGIIGLGRIGRKMARMAGLGFRMRVLGFDPRAGKGPREVQDIPIFMYDELSSMLEQCDFVSIHCTLNPGSKKLMGEKEFQCMKPTAFLINVSRGEIVDEMALLTALQDKRIAGAALDVYSQEPLTLQGHPLSPLFRMDNVLLSPHLTFYTQDAMARLQKETMDRCWEIIQSRPVLIKSHDPRLRSQSVGVVFSD